MSTNELSSESEEGRDAGEDKGRDVTKAAARSEGKSWQGEQGGRKKAGKNIDRCASQDTGKE